MVYVTWCMLHGVCYMVYVTSAVMTRQADMLY